MSFKSLNKVMLIGNLTRNPRLKVTPSGASICTFSLATNSSYKKPEGTYEEITNFHDIVAWSKLADICAKKLNKGDKVYVEGELRSRKWEEDGVKRQKCEVRITDMKIIQEKIKSSETDDETDSLEDATQVDVDDLPF